MSKLNESIVKEIRIKFKNKEITTLELAEKYGLSRCSFYNIINGKSWKHVV
jgi:hypothetical protein